MVFLSWPETPRDCMNKHLIFNFLLTSQLSYKHKSTYRDNYFHFAIFTAHQSYDSFTVLQASCSLSYFPVLGAHISLLFWGCIWCNSWSRFIETWAWMWYSVSYEKYYQRSWLHIGKYFYPNQESTIHIVNGLEECRSLRNMEGSLKCYVRLISGRKLHVYGDSNVFFW